jgi:hypothetical protein
MQTSLSTIRMVAHNLKITAILKLPKLALCPCLHYDTASLRGRGGGATFVPFVILSTIRHSISRSQMVVFVDVELLEKREEKNKGQI